MPISQMSSRDFNQHTSRAKKAAGRGPVIITERGRPAHVLMTFEDYQRLTGAKGSLIEQLGQPSGVEDVELEISPLRDPVRPADLY